MIEGHGDDLYRYPKGKIKHNFSSNILSGVDHSGLVEYLHNLGDYFSSYPDPKAESLAGMIAAREKIHEGCVAVTNGVTEAIYLIAQLFKECDSAIERPTFREYADACKLFGHKVIDIISPDQARDSDLVWICNPNNPTGIVQDAGRLLDLASANPDRIYIIDGAYSSYTEERTITAAEAVEAGNIILLKSLTKDFSIPGLRIGYVVADRDLISGIDSRRMPWSVNSTAIEAARYLLSHSDEYRIDARSLNDEASRICSEFRNMSIGVSGDRPQSNFILCQLRKGNATDLKEYLVEKYGILIRDASNFAGCDNTCFRVAAQTPGENDLLISAIKEWMLS